MKVLLFLFSLISIPSPVLASGFYTPDIGARTVGRGGAFIVGVNDLTALYLNPAGLAHVRGENLMIVNNFAVFHTAYRRSPYERTVHNRNPLDVIQFAALSSNFGLHDFTFALGMFGPYSVAEDYDPTGPQRYVIDQIQRLQLYYLIGAGWRPFDWLRVGLEVGVGEFGEHDKYCFSPFDDGNPENDVVADVNISQFGNMMYGAGIQLGPYKGFEFGFSYQPPNDLILKGDIKAKLTPLEGAAAGGRVYKDKITVNTKFPAIARFGIRQRLTEKFDLEADAIWIGWSRFKEQDINFEKGTLMDDYTVPINWRDTWGYRFGGDYELIDNLSLRAGGWYERSATPLTRLEPGAIEADRWSLAGGFGYFWRGLTLNFAYSHIWMDPSTVSSNILDKPEMGDPRGTYRGNYDMYLLGMNINFNTVIAEMKGTRR